jgi:hypothetical protein
MAEHMTGNELPSLDPEQVMAAMDLWATAYLIAATSEELPSGRFSVAAALMTSLANSAHRLAKPLKASQGTLTGWPEEHAEKPRTTAGWAPFEDAKADTAAHAPGENAAENGEADAANG